MILVMVMLAGLNGLGKMIGDLDNFPGNLGDSINPDVLSFPE